MSETAVEKNKTEREYNPLAVKKLFRFTRAWAIFVSGLNLRGELCTRPPSLPFERNRKRNKNGNDARDIIDRLNRRSFARLLFEK